MTPLPPQSEWNHIIAERCGWTNRRRLHNCPGENYFITEWFSPTGEANVPIPNYIGSLDAMAQAEATLSNTNHYKFRCALWNIATKNNKSITGWPQNRAYTSATALQRAEAFIIATNPTGENE